MQESSIVVAARFRGPPGSGNGGYVSGRLADPFPGAVEVTLRRPTPLDRPLAVACDGDGARLLDGGTVVAEARCAPLALDVPPPPAPAAIEAAAEETMFGTGDYATCFGCGRDRHPPDSLCIRPRRLDAGSPLVAALWTPHPGQADERGFVPPAFLWAALDCPGGLAALGGDAPAALTGRLHAEVDADLAPGTPCRIVGWLAGIEGRKRLAGTALFDASGRLRGRALATWILLRAA